MPSRRRARGGTIRRRRSNPAGIEGRVQRVHGRRGEGLGGRIEESSAAAAAAAGAAAAAERGVFFSGERRRRRRRRSGRGRFAASRSKTSSSSPASSDSTIPTLGTVRHRPRPLRGGIDRAPGRGTVVGPNEGRLRPRRRSPFRPRRGLRSRRRRRSTHVERGGEIPGASRSVPAVFEVGIVGASDVGDGDGGGGRRRWRRRRRKKRRRRRK
mmetsp:Transcript_40635/g.122315  ORF Transcript_40635/g.122315 Transcript_40635/m.122315 type:complete len:212 (+) Transcript_40635:556-1191(+)